MKDTPVVLRAVDKSRHVVKSPTATPLIGDVLGIPCEEPVHKMGTGKVPGVIARLHTGYHPAAWPAIERHLTAQDGPVRTLLNWFTRQGHAAAAAGSPDHPQYCHLVAETALGAACLICYAQGHLDELEARAVKASNPTHWSPPHQQTGSPKSQPGPRQGARATGRGEHSRRPGPGRPGTRKHRQG